MTRHAAWNRNRTNHSEVLIDMSSRCPSCVLSSKKWKGEMRVSYGWGIKIIERLDALEQREKDV